MLVFHDGSGFGILALKTANTNTTYSLCNVLSCGIFLVTGELYNFQTGFGNDEPQRPVAQGAA
jgi:hypothetical protein